MAWTTMTSKGQMTLPKEIRDRLRLKPGDRLDVRIEERHIVLTPRTRHLDDVYSALPRATRARSIDEMDAAVRARASRRQ